MMRKSEDSGLPVLAIDLGGTKIASAIISKKGRVVAWEQCPTLADEGPQPVISRIFSAIDYLLSLESVAPSELHSVSIAAAGAIDFEKGIVTASPNLPGWNNIPLRDIIGEKYGVETFLINDASAAALGEYHFGVGRGVSNLIYLTVSTGIGGGIIINDRLYTGVCGGAGEIGHTTVDINGPRCNCGNIGCLETLASGTAVAKEAIRRISGGEKSSLAGMVGGRIEDITAEAVGVAARDGDRLALEVVSRAAGFLGVGMVNLVNIFNPEMIIVGGGMVRMGDLLLGPARRVVKERAFSLPARAVRIVPARLGDHAGVLGVAVFAREQNWRGGRDEDS
jgi:glucokinase